MKMPAPCGLSLLKDIPSMNNQPENEDVSAGKTDVKIMKVRKERGSLCFIAVLLL